MTKNRWVSTPALPRTLRHLPSANCHIILQAEPVCHPPKETPAVHLKLAKRSALCQIANSADHRTPDIGYHSVMPDDVRPPTLSYRTPRGKPPRPPRDPDWSRWRYRRVFFRIGLFVLLVPPTIHWGNNVFMFGKLTNLSPADFVTRVQSLGVPTVRAMKQYERDTGHMPDQMGDLIPKYLPSAPEPWGQDVQGGRFEMYDHFRDIVTYDFTPGAEGWSVQGPFANGPIPLPPVTLGTATMPAHGH
jgi:hypothetical protein